MTLAIVSLPLEYFPDPNRGRPIYNGQIFVGEPDLDPEILANRKAIVARQEDGTDIPMSPAQQPVRTGKGGVPEYNGATVQILVEGNYSIKVLDRTGAQEYYWPNVFDGQPIVVGDDHNLLGNRNAIAAHDQIYARKTTVAEIFTGVFSAGDIISVTDRDSSLWDVISGGSPNGYNILDAGNLNTAVLRVGDSVMASHYGLVIDGVTDDYGAASAAISDGKTLIKKVFFPAGEMKISQTLFINGVSVEGVLSGYFNRQGTSFKGDGTFDIISQSSYSVDEITHTLKNIRVTDGLTGFNYAYIVNSVYDNLYIERCNVGIRIGRATLFGPLFNIINNVNAIDMVEYGMVLGGDVNNNNNLFYQGFYDGRIAGILQEPINLGIGATNNTFLGVEIGSNNSNVGIIFRGPTRSMNIQGCYFEPVGTNIIFQGQSFDCVLQNNFYAGAFQFDAEGAMIISRLINDITFIGGDVYQAPKPNKDYTFFYADFTDTQSVRERYDFVSDPYVETFTNPNEYQGLANFDVTRFSEVVATNRLDVTSTRDPNINTFKTTYEKQLPDIAALTTILEVKDANLVFSSCVLNVRVTMSARNLTTPYLYGFNLDLTITYDQTSRAVVENDFTVFADPTLQLSYLISDVGSNMILQITSGAITTDRVNLIVDVTGCGDSLDGVIT